MKLKQLTKLLPQKKHHVTAPMVVVPAIALVATGVTQLVRKLKRELKRERVVAELQHALAERHAEVEHDIARMDAEGGMMMPVPPLSA